MLIDRRDEEADRSQAMASALATFFKQIGFMSQKNNSLLERCSSFNARDRKMFKFKSNTKKATIISSQSVQSIHYYRLLTNRHWNAIVILLPRWHCCHGDTDTVKPPNVTHRLKVSTFVVSLHPHPLLSIVFWKDVTLDGLDCPLIVEMMFLGDSDEWPSVHHSALLRDYTVFSLPNCFMGNR